jgi:hypothetical protein
MYLGIDGTSGHVYEGTERASFPAVPAPILTPAKLIIAEVDWDSLPVGVGHPMPWMFREDTFDPVTRTRRGRLYQPIMGQNPSPQRVVPHPYGSPLAAREPKELWLYTACLSLLSAHRQGEGATLALGTSQGHSAWRIIQREILASGDVLVTLKSLSAFAILPDVDTAEIPDEFREPITDALERVLTSAFRETPMSVIDHCRNAMTMILSRWMVAQGHDATILADDLGKVAAAVGAAPFDKGCVCRLAQVIARLHVRGKGNEAHARGLRDPVEEDAELALRAVGFTLRDIGWAA